MNSRLKISDDVSLPRDFVTSTDIVYGGKGMGKTNLGSVLVEEMTKQNLRWCTLDPMGVWWGLRHSPDGKGPGIECVILGGAHGDIPIEPTGGAVVADLVVDENTNTIIDFSRKANGQMWTVGEKIRFVTDYTYRLFQRQGELINGHRREPMKQILDEAARYIPQVIPSGAIDLAKCVAAWEQVAEEGRNIGLGVTFLTQRSARMNKSVSELADVMFAFRTIGPNSLRAVMDWLGEHVEKSHVRELASQVRELNVGQALVVSPGWLRLEKIATIRPRETFDSSATPKPGQHQKKVTGKAAKPDLAKYQERMAATIERAHLDDPKALRKRISELETQSKKATPQNAVREKTVEKRIAVPVLKDAQITRLENIFDRMVKEAERHGSAMALLWGHFNEMGDALLGAMNALKPPVTPPPVRPTPAHREFIPKPTRAPVDPDGNITGPEQRILNAIAWMESIGITEPEQTAVAFLADYTYGGGGFNNPKGSLRTKGMIEYRGSRLAFTDAGRAASQAPSQPLTTEELHQHVLGRLPTPEQRVLRPLLDGRELSNEELAAEAGYAAGTGGFNNPKGRLRTLGLVDYPSPGRVKASQVLFL
jgi:hypothetical protein